MKSAEKCKEEIHMNKKKTAFLIALIGIVCAGVLFIILNRENGKILYQDNNITLSALKTNEEIQCYEDFKIKYLGKTKRFEKWRNTTLSEQPEVVLFQQNSYIFINLTLGTGTGIEERRLHILDAGTLEEVPVEYAKKYILTNVDKIDLSGVPEESNEIHIIHKGENIGSYKVPEDVITSAMSNSVDWGRMTTYWIEDGILHASLAGFASPSLCIGSLELRYEIIENEFRVADISFIPAE